MNKKILINTKILIKDYLLNYKRFIISILSEAI